VSGEKPKHVQSEGVKMHVGHHPGGSSRSEPGTQGTKKKGKGRR